MKNNSLFQAINPLIISETSINQNFSLTKIANKYEKESNLKFNNYD